MAFRYNPLTQAAPQDDDIGFLEGLGGVATDAASGALSLGSSMAAPAQLAAERSGDQEAARFYRGAGMALHAGQDALQDLQSDDYRQGKGDLAAHPVARIASGVAGAVPYLGAFALLPESMVLQAGAGGGLQAGSEIDEVLSKTNSMTNDELMKEVPLFKQLVDGGMDPDSALAELHVRQIQNQDLITAALIGGPGGVVAGRLVRGATPGGNLLPRTAKGAGEGAAVMGAMGGHAAYVAENADVAAGIKDDVNWGNIGDRAAHAALDGSVLMGGGAAMFGRPAPAAKHIETVDALGPDAAQAAATRAGMPSVEAITPEVTAEPRAPLARDANGLITAPTEAPSLPPTRWVRDEAGNIVDTRKSGDSIETVPEAPATIAAQTEALVDPANERKAQYFPKGTDLPPLPAGMKQLPTKDGVVYYDPKKLKPKQITAAVKAGKLGELLDLGPFNKGEVAERVAQGEQPVAVTERTPDGLEIKAAAGTEGTAPVQARVLEETKTPGNVVSVEEPVKVVADRAAMDAMLTGDKELPPAPPATPLEASQLGIDQPAVVTPKAKEAVAKAKKVEVPEADPATEALAAQGIDEAPHAVPAPELEVPATVDTEPHAKPAKKGKNYTKAELEQRAQMDDLFKRFPVAESTTIPKHADVRARLEQLEQAANELGIKVPKKVSYENTPEGVMFLREAMDLLNEFRTRGTVKLSRLREFQAREWQLRNGEKAAVAESRKVEGDVHSKRATVEEHSHAAEEHDPTLTGEVNDFGRGKHEDEVTGRVKDVTAKDELREAGFQVEEAPEGERAGPVEDEHYEVDEARAAENARILAEREAKAKERAERREADERAAKMALVTKDAVTAGKNATGSGIQAVRKPKLVKNADGSYSRVKGDATRLSYDHSEWGDPHPDEAKRVEAAIDGKSVHEAAKWLAENSSSPAERAIAERVVTMLARLAAAGHKFEPVKVVHVGDRVPVQILRARAAVVMNYRHPDAAMRKTQLYVNGHDVQGKVGASTATVLHELVHAATMHAIAAGGMKTAIGTRLGKAVADLRSVSNAIIAHFNKRAAEAKAGRLELSDFEKEIFQGRNNALADMEEIVSWSLTDPRMQQYLEGIRYEGKSMFSRFVEAVRSFLGLNPKADTALSEVLRVSDHLLDADIGEIRDAGELAGIRLQVDAGAIKDRAAETAKDWGIDLARLGRKARMATDTLTMVAHRATRLGNVFGEQARTVAELAQRMDIEKHRLIERKGGGLEVATEGAELARKYGDSGEFAKAVDLAFHASELNVNLGRGANNDHLGKDSTEGWQAKAKVKGMQVAFDKLPEDLQSWLQKAASFGRSERNAQAYDLVKNILHSADVTDPAVVQRIFDHGMTDADKALFETNKVAEHVAKARQLRSMAGWYFPFMREGNHVVSARREVTMPTGPGVTRVADNVVQFHTPNAAIGDAGGVARKMAEKFVADHELPHADTEKVWVDRNDPSKILPAEDTNAVVAYRVTMQDKHVEFHASESDAVRAAERLRAEGYKDVYNELKRENPNGKWSGLMSSQFETMLRSLSQRDGFKRMDEGQQKLLIDAMREANIRLLPGNRLQKHSLSRNNVAGYSKDIIRSLSRYAQVSAGYRAKMRFQPEIDAALEGMKAEMLAHRYDGKASQRVETFQEIESRVYRNKDIEPDDNFSTATRRLAQISMIDKLAGPSFHVINSMEPWTTTLPIIAGRHGLKAVGSLKRAYSLIGARGAVGAGLHDMVHAANHDLGFTSYLDTFKREIAKTAGTGARAQRLGDVLDYLHDRNLFGHEAGMEMQRVAEPSSSAFGRAVDRVDLMARQVGAAIEAINRATSGLAAYELEYAKNGGDHAAAMRYAHDVVHDTMGNYAASNAAPIFNTNVGRLALQFKKFGQKTYYLLGKLISRSAQGDTEAMRQFAGLMFTHAVLAGGLGLPLEPIKVALIAANALGAPFSYQDFEEMVRTAAANVFGAKGGEALTRGVPRALGVDLSARMGMESLLTFGTPRSAKQQDLKAWLFDTAAGAPMGTVLKEIQAVQAAMGGDYLGAADKAIPIKAVRDLGRAVRYSVQPKTDSRGRATSEPYNPAEALVRATGFTPSREANEYEARAALSDNRASTKAQTQKLIDGWVNAKGSDKTKAFAEITAYNRGKPKDAQITMQRLTSAQRRGEVYKDENVAGFTPGHGEDAVVERVKRVYGVK